MKKVYCIVLFIFILARTALAKPIDENIVILKYNKAINGLKVEALWIPKVLRNGYARGPAIIKLTDEDHGVSSTVVSNNFTMTEDSVEKFIEWKRIHNEDTTVQRILIEVVNLDYKNPKIPEGECRLGVTDVPFFFYDLNFDEKKELLVGEVETGQRWRTTFKAYELDDSEHFVLKDPYFQITYEEPYISLDELSTVNKENRTIKIHYSAGAADSFSEVYKLQYSLESGRKKFVSEEIVGSK